MYLYILSLKIKSHLIYFYLLFSKAATPMIAAFFAYIYITKMARTVPFINTI
jgi:hypothetical protein